MGRRRGSGSGLFLMEMIVAVFFFILCASVCVLAFAKSDSMSRTAKASNQAVILSQTVAEIWKAEGTEGLESRLDVGFGESVGRIYLDESWSLMEEADAKKAAYRADMELGTAGDGRDILSVSVWNVGISIWNQPGAGGQEEPLFVLEVSRYVPGQ